MPASSPEKERDQEPVQPLPQEAVVCWVVLFPVSELVAVAIRVPSYTSALPPRLMVPLPPFLVVTEIMELPPLVLVLVSPLPEGAISIAPPSRVVSALSLLTVVLGEGDGFLLAVAFLLSEVLVPEVPVEVSDLEEETSDSLVLALARSEALAEALEDADAEADTSDGPAIGVGALVGFVPVQPVNKKAATANAESWIFMTPSVAWVLARNLSQWVALPRVNLATRPFKPRLSAGISFVLPLLS